MQLLRVSSERLNPRLCMGRDLQRVSRQKGILLITSKCFTIANDVIHIWNI